MGGEAPSSCLILRCTRSSCRTIWFALAPSFRRSVVGRGAGKIRLPSRVLHFNDRKDASSTDVHATPSLVMGSDFSALHHLQTLSPRAEQALVHNLKIQGAQNRQLLLRSLQVSRKHRPESWRNRGERIWSVPGAVRREELLEEISHQINTMRNVCYE